MSDLQSLIERVEKATCGGNELSARVICALAAPEGAVVEQSFINGNWCIYHGTDRLGRPALWEERDWFRQGGWPVTESLDAALSLVARVFPGWRVLTEHGDNYSRVYFRRGWGAREETLGVATTERADDEIALCLIEALLRAVSHVPAKNEATEETRA